MTRFEQLYGIPLAKRRRMEILIALMALEIIFAFSYLGFIIIPPISITTMHLLVMIAAMILGTREMRGDFAGVCADLDVAGRRIGRAIQ